MHVKVLGCAHTKGRSGSICHASCTSYRPTLSDKTESQKGQKVLQKKKNLTRKDMIYTDHQMSQFILITDALLT